VLRTKGHRFSVTSAVASESGKYLFTSGKEGSIIKWDLLTGQKMKTFYKIRPPPSLNEKGNKASFDAKILGHTDEVLALAVSCDGKYLASGGRDQKLGVWDAEKGEWIQAIGGHLSHRDLISVRFLSADRIQYCGLIWFP
jgi:ribosomal RNA-processing protein 9